MHIFANMYGAFDVVLYFVNPTVLVANKLTSYLICQRCFRTTPLRTLVIRFISTFIYCDQYCTATIYSATCSARGAHIVYVFPNKQSINQSINQMSPPPPTKNYTQLRTTAHNCAQLRTTTHTYAQLRTTRHNYAQLRTTAHKYAQLRTTTHNGRFNSFINTISFHGSRRFIFTGSL